MGKNNKKQIEVKRTYTENGKSINELFKKYIESIILLNTESKV